MFLSIFFKTQNIRIRGIVLFSLPSAHLSNCAMYMVLSTHLDLRLQNYGQWWVVDDKLRFMQNLFLLLLLLSQWSMIGRVWSDQIMWL